MRFFDSIQNFTGKHARKISITSYALSSFIFSLYYKPRYSYIFLPLLLFEIYKSYEMSKNTQMNLSKYFIDNFMYDNSSKTVRYALICSLIVYAGRNAAVNYLQSSENIPTFLFMTLLLNCMAFLQGYFFAQFIPNPNAVDRKIFTKILIILCCVISMFPLANHNALYIMENLYVSTFFMTICGYLDGCCQVSDGRSSFFCVNYLKVIYLMYLAGSLFANATLGKWRLKY